MAGLVGGARGGGGFGLVVGLYGLWRAEPAYWKERAVYLRAHTDKQLLDIAQSVEDKLAAAAETPEVPLAQEPSVEEPVALGDVVEPEALQEPEGRVADDPYVIKTLLPDQAVAGSETGEAELVERGVETEAGRSLFSLVPGEEVPQRVRLSMNEVNTWMDRRLERWLRSQGKHLPKEV